MIALSLTGARRILCLGAHSDDIEIGCGASILSAIEANPDREITWVVFSSDDQRRAEGERSASAFLAGAGAGRVVSKEFRESHFPWCASEIKDFLDELRGEFAPDVVFTHWRGDAHQDHRTVSELTWNAFRDQLILEYEIPKWDGDMGAPNVFVPVSEAHARKKVAVLMECFASQKQRDWFTEDLFLGLMRVRGMECRSPSRFAEAYYASKLRLSLDGGR